MSEFLRLSDVYALSTVSVRGLVRGRTGESVGEHTGPAMVPTVWHGDDAKPAALGLWQAGSSSATWSPRFELRTQVDVLALTGHHILELQQVCVDAYKQ